MAQRELFRGCTVWLVLIAATLAQAADAPDIVQVLRQWERATAEHDRSTAAPDWEQHTQALSVHELAAAQALCSPVSARTLIEQYEWSAAAGESGAFVLTAVPRDPLARLFFSGVDLEFERGTAVPKTLTFRDSQRRRRPVVIVVPAAGGVQVAEATDNAGGVRLVALTELSETEVTAATPELSAVLVQWSSTTEGIDRAEISFVRYTCDLVAGTEERSTGRLYFEQPERGVYELRPSEVPADAKSERKAQNGAALTVTSGPARIYVWDQDRLRIARPDDKQYEEFRVPRRSDVQLAGSADRTWTALAMPQRTLPATVDVHTDRFLERYEWSLLQADDRRLILQGRPVADADQWDVSELQVILDSATYRAQATRLISGNRERETVHVLNWVAVNDELPQRDWRPDLTGYQAVDPVPLAPPAEAPALSPAAE